MTEFISLALRPDVVRRALLYAVVVGGIIPPRDHEALRAGGVAAIFGPGTPIPTSAREVLRVLRDRLG